MDVASVELRANIQDWDESDVHAWLTTLGLPQYENQIHEHRVSGDVLCLMDADALKEVGVATIGQRLAILKAVYQLKLAQQIPIEADHYVPPSEIEERQQQRNVDKLFDLLREHGERLRSLEEDNRRLGETLHSCLEDISSLRSSTAPRQTEAESPVTRVPSFKWASFVKSTRSPTKPTAEATLDSPQSSPQRAEHDFTVSRGSAPSASSSDKRGQSSLQVQHGSTNGNSTTSSQVHSVPTRPLRQDSSDNLKIFKVSLDDPAWKVLPAALRKYKINNDDWQNYAMFICYGPPGNRIERCLSYDEKPLLLFQKLKEAKKSPVFMLKHIKDIRSPIAVAQQKQAARKAETSITQTPPLTGTSASSHGTSQPNERPLPPKLLVDSRLNGVAPGLNTAGVNGNAWPPEVMSPAVENKERADDFAQTGESSKSHLSTTSLVTASSTTVNDHDNSVPNVREIPPSTGLSYAVAIYPYMAEQEDEFDVVVGDTFIILSRARGWWVVQRDPAGSGLVEPDTTKQGWVPAGCLLETNVPVATAIADATARTGVASGSLPSTPPGATPILPLSILSTSFPGVALTDYKKKGEEELDLVKDDSLRVFKRYNHWSYAVKEESGDRGWVPSWYIGKVPPTTGAPATPNTGGAPQHFGSGGGLTLEGDSRYAGDTPGSQQAQVSPMSSAFPPIQTRTATVA